MRTTGLARLLVLEQLPTSRDREEYTQKRREERGRPPSYTSSYRSIRKLRGNIKNDWEDEVAEWVDEEEISDYHTIVSSAVFPKHYLLCLLWCRQSHMVKSSMQGRLKSFYIPMICF